MAVPRIVFLDHTTPRPYDSNTLLTEPIGGTEATVVRIAEGLAATDKYDVIVAQHNRATQGTGLANYTSFEALDQIQHDPKVVVAIRSPQLVPFAKKRWNSKFCLWMHDFNQQDVVRSADDLADTRILCVSKAQKTVVTDSVLSQVRDPKFTIGYIYNPISDDLVPDDTTVNHRKLIFFSSPHKGLEYTLKVFDQIRRQDNNYELIVANPGYLPDADNLPEGVRSVGALPHHEAIALVRSALCVFHLNTVFPETFGLVHAEAGAVNTPTITSHFGANPEVLSPAYAQMMDVRNERAVVNRVIKWGQEGRPTVNCRPEFRLSSVISKWEALINA